MKAGVEGFYAGRLNAEQIEAMPVRRKKPIFLIFLATVLMAGAVAYYAPRYLAYADNPRISDTIIAFEGGGDDAARKKEAYQLRSEGYAGIILIPASNTVLRSNSVPLRNLDALKNNAGFADTTHYPSFYENTHVEILRAKKMMDVRELKSAILVSSPYHMRRIRMIARSVFGEQARLFTYVPTRYERSPAGLFDMNAADWMFVIQEYVKACWFGLYSPFIDNSSNRPKMKGSFLEYVTY
jgi:uncharacterized SAM-binding protein YcdF (DUF218 family)